MKRSSLVIALLLATVAMLVAQANYQGWKDVGGTLVTYNKVGFEATAGAGQDLLFARTAAGHAQFQTGIGGVATDVQGTCTAAASTTCTVTFGVAFTAAPVCLVTDQTTAANNALKATPSTTNLVITTTSSSDIFSYFCLGK